MAEQAKLDPSEEALDRTGGPPLYVQLRERIRKLAEGAEPGQRLFSDDELAARFDVNRLTVRHAVEELVAQGLLTRIRGVGTVVNERPVRSRFRYVERFFSEWSEQGRRIDVELLAFERRPCPLPYADWLHLPTEADVQYVARRRWVDEEPMAVDDRYVRLEYAHVLTRVDIVVRPLFETISAQLGLDIIDGYNELQAIRAGNDSAPLELTEADPVLRRRLVLYTEGRAPVLAGETRYRGDRFSYCFGGERVGDLRLSEERPEAQEATDR
jgi:GntR family transcriptional regulator